MTIWPCVLQSKSDGVNSSDFLLILQDKVSARQTCYCFHLH